MPDENNEREDNKKEKEDENKYEDYEPKVNTARAITKRDTERF